MTATTRFALPLLHAGQAQKEQFHNEALTQIDTLLHPLVQSLDRTTPPVTPEAGQAWIVGGNAEGDWAGHEDDLATWTPGGWRFATPVRGMWVWVDALGLPASFLPSGWHIGVVEATKIRIGGLQVLGERQAPIAEPSGGTVIDIESRDAIASILEALRNHGLIETV